jgi:hypothetical protein
MTDSPVSHPAHPQAPRFAPYRLLGLLALLVMLVHWWLLGTIALEVTVEPAIKPLNPTALVFNTRRIEVPPVTVAQPKPVLIQKPKTQTPKVAAEPMTLESITPESMIPLPTVAEVSPETPPAAPEQSLSAENANPSAAATDIPKAESPAAPATTETTRTNETPTVQANFNIPGSVRLKYEMTGLSGGFTYHATGVMTWLQDGSRYDANMVVSAFLIGSRSLSSVGDITLDGLAPKRFADKGRNELAAHFQADKRKITFSANTPDAPWKRGVQDRLSVFFQLASLLAGQPDGFPMGTKIPIYTAGQKDAVTWTFSVAGHEEMNLPQGPVTAIKLTRDPRQAFDQRVEAWFAPSLGYWPVRIKVTQQSGDYIDQQLSSSGPP